MSKNSTDFNFTNSLVEENLTALKNMEYPTRFGMVLESAVVAHNSYLRLKGEANALLSVVLEGLNTGTPSEEARAALLKCSTRLAKVINDLEDSEDGFRLASAWLRAANKLAAEDNIRLEMEASTERYLTELRATAPAGLKQAVDELPQELKDLFESLSTNTRRH